jgi:WD40 repeat protein
MDLRDWKSQIIENAHSLSGCTSMAWKPAISQLADDSEHLTEKHPPHPFSEYRLTSGGADGKLYFWKYDEQDQDGWYKTDDGFLLHSESTNSHKLWSSLAWDSSGRLLASATLDGSVFIWSQQRRPGGVSKLFWYPRTLSIKPTPFPYEVWQVAWSPMSLYLVVSCGVNHVSLWKETLSGRWECFKELSDPCPLL